MILNNIPKINQINSEKLKIRLLESGDIYDIISGDNQINLLRGNILDGSVMNLYMKVYENEFTYTTPLLGVKSPSSFQLDDNKAYYSGCFHGINYNITLLIEDTTWFHNISFHSQDNIKVTFYYGQDVGINPISSVISSEPYTVQYIDYKVFHNKNGYQLCARQNQGQHQYLQIGSNSKTVGYSTDGFQFFGTEYKKTNIPKAYTEDTLDSEIYQYEFSYLALQTETITSQLNPQKTTFYGYYDDAYVGIITEPEHIKIPEYDAFKTIENKEFKKGLLQTDKVLHGKDLKNNYYIENFKNVRHEEYQDDKLLSFFTENYHHVVTQSKELIVERPHGHLMIHGDIEHASENVMATTNFMFGVFNSHIVLGNTTFNKFLGDVRNPLNIQKASGQRLYIKINGEYQLLGLPSYYDMGATTTTWTYVLEDDVLKITSVVDIGDTTQRLLVTSNNNYDIILAQQVLMGGEEYLYNIEYSINDGIYTFSAPSDSMIGLNYSDLTYQMKTSPEATVLSENHALGYEAKMGMFVLSFENSNNVVVDLKASLDGKQNMEFDMDVIELDLKGKEYFESYFYNLGLESEDNEISKIVDITFWYTHNALVHYSSPHGLEQYNGAAWGTRDICQGPAELFFAAQRFDLVREILLKVYQRQFLENGDFPQWFMFDKYYKIQAHESHGDIIIWPLRLLAYYLKCTDDYSILDEEVPYMSINNNDYTNKESIYEHVKYQLKAIEDSFIQGTHLPKYGGGDWDDTLQPANHDLKETMVSGWTVALLYDTIDTLANQIKQFDESIYQKLMSQKENIKKDYERYIIADELPSGFVVFNDKNKLLIHPSDNQTGIKYRLLPYLRSMISSLATKKQTHLYQDVINQQLKHPDGVRLMDKTVTYQGGKQTYFQRAETAANFGREIGLQYVHAHIRYIEAMYHIGNPKDAYRGFYEINPITIKKTVKNGMYRQSNVYFSSSDANFKTRYEAQKNFGKIRSGELGVKGGWRLYSSGPGIYIKQVISNLVGIEQYHNKLLIDPSSYKTAKLNKISYNYHNRKLVINIHKGKPRIIINDSSNNFEEIYNKYRFKGYLIDPTNLDKKADIKIDLWVE